MSSIKDLEMAAAVSSYEHISIKKSFLGLSQKAVYTPTNSPVKVVISDYAPLEGEHLEHLLDLSLDKLANELRTKGKPSPAAIGHYRLELCISEDHQFCALQLFRFVDFKNSPVFEPRFYEGSDAEIFANLL